MIPASLRDRKRRAEVVSGLAPENDACRTKSCLENICLRAGLAQSLQHRTSVGDGYRHLSTGWHWHDTGGNLNLRKPQQIKTWPPLLMQSSPSPFLSVLLCLFLAVWFCFLLSLLFVAVLLIWHQLVLPGCGGPPQPSLPTRAPHLSFRCGISPCGAAASCPAPELGSAVRLWAKGVHFSSSQFQNLKQS